MPDFDHYIAPAFSPYLRPDQPEALQLVAVYLVDDVVEFGGAAAHKYIPSLVPTFIHNSRSENPLLRQSSVYGLGKAVLLAPSILCQHLNTVVPCIMEVVNSNSSAALAQKKAAAAASRGDDEDEDEEEEDDGEGVVENAVLALSSICTDMQYREALLALGAAGGGHGLVQQLVGTWLQRLPLKTDELQSKVSCRQLCDALELGDSLLLADGGNVQHVLRIFAEVFQSLASGCEDGGGAYAGVHPLTADRMRRLLRTWMGGDAASSSAAVAVAAAARAAVGGLSAELQEVLKSAM
jgi:hypothetical protein